MAQTQHTGTPRRTLQRAFTLVEMLVIIAIIMLLIAIGVAGMNTFYAEASKNQTRFVLSTLASVDTEYRAQMQVTNVPDGTGTNEVQAFHTLDDDESNIEDYLEVVWRLPACRELLETLPDSVVERDEDDDSIILVKDGWENDICYVRYDGDDEILPYNSGDPYFASRGQDGEWGNPEGNDDEKEQLEDNIYSFEVDQ